MLLVQNLSDYHNFPQDVQEAVEAIKNLALSKKWDPTLSPKTSKLLQKVCRDYTQSKMPRPNCAKKLDFI